MLAWLSGARGLTPPHGLELAGPSFMGALVKQATAVPTTSAIPKIASLRIARARSFRPVRAVTPSIKIQRASEWSQSIRFLIPAQNHLQTRDFSIH
jgi:hypothetical protein